MCVVEKPLQAKGCFTNKLFKGNEFDNVVYADLRNKFRKL